MIACVLDHTLIMMRSHWMRRGLLGAYTLLTAFILAHSVNAFVEYSLAGRRSEPVTLSPQSSVEVAQRDPNMLMQSILTSRLFPVPPDASPASAQRGAAPKAPPLDVTKKFLLLGTVVSQDGVAILEELSSKKQTLYHLNETVSSIGTIAKIEKDRVLFRHNDQEEWLNMAIGTLRPGFEPGFAVPVQPALQPTPGKTIQASSSRRKRIDRQLLIEADNDSTKLFIHGQPSPFLVDGRVQGVRLDAVNFFGFYGKLGLLTGDVVKRVNGVELHDPTRLPSIVHLLKNERTFTLDILRNETPLTLTYDMG
jgi:general secretion pathway protein C